MGQLEVRRTWNQFVMANMRFGETQNPQLKFHRILQYSLQKSMFKPYPRIITLYSPGVQGVWSLDCL